MFTSKKKEGINTFVCAVSLYVAKTPKASIKDHETRPLPIIPSALLRTVLLDNLSRDSCIYLADSRLGKYSSLSTSTSVELLMPTSKLEKLT